jgi:hypothetical protein
VLCYGLRSDFRGDPFPGSVMLLALADDLEEMKTDGEPEPPFALYLACPLGSE